MAVENIQLGFEQADNMALVNLEEAKFAGSLVTNFDEFNSLTGNDQLPFTD